MKKIDLKEARTIKGGVVLSLSVLLSLLSGACALASIFLNKK